MKILLLRSALNTNYQMYYSLPKVPRRRRRISWGINNVVIDHDHISPSVNFEMYSCTLR